MLIHGYITSVSLELSILSLHQLFSAPIGHSDLCGKATHRSETKSVCPKKITEIKLLWIIESIYLFLPRKFVKFLPISFLRNEMVNKRLTNEFDVLWGLGVFIITFLSLSDAQNDQVIDPFD